MAEKSGPEKYAPPDRRASEMLHNPDQAKTNTVERNIRELARREGPFPHPRRSEDAAAKDATIESLDGLIRRVAAASMDEIDRVIRELESVRDMMRNEGERVTREISSYASLSHSATTAMKVIADSIKQWKNASDKSGGPSSVS